MVAPVVVIGFLIALLSAVGLAVLAFLSWRSSQPSSFFLESVEKEYKITLPETEINAYLKMKAQQELMYNSDVPPRPEEEVDPTAEKESPDPDGVHWVQKIPEEKRNVLQRALLNRLVATITTLDQVQRDRPGNWKLWRRKVVSEHFWTTFCDAERRVGEEINECIMEAEDLLPGSGWKDNIFTQAVEHWRIRKREEKVAKDEKKQRDEVGRRQQNELREVLEAKQRQEKNAEKARKQLLREEEMKKPKNSKEKVEEEKKKPKKFKGEVQGEEVTISGQNLSMSNVVIHHAVSLRCWQQSRRSRPMF